MPLVVPATEVLPPALVVAPAPPALVVAPAPVVPPVELRLSSPLPPHAEAKAAAPESTNTAAHKFDFEVVRMGSTDHLSEQSSQCTEWIQTFI